MPPSFRRPPPPLPVLRWAGKPGVGPCRNEAPKFSWSLFRGALLSPTGPPPLPLLLVYVKPPRSPEDRMTRAPPQPTHRPFCGHRSASCPRISSILEPADNLGRISYSPHSSPVSSSFSIGLLSPLLVPVEEYDPQGSLFFPPPLGTLLLPGLPARSVLIPLPTTVSRASLDRRLTSPTKRVSPSRGPRAFPRP